MKRFFYFALLSAVLVVFSLQEAPEASSAEIILSPESSSAESLSQTSDEGSFETDCPYLLDFLRIDLANNPSEVEKLQRFLQEREGHFYLEVNGFFDQATFEAVSIFQTKYQEDILSPWGIDYPTGYVYLTTRRKINQLYCQQDYPLTSGQQAEIDNYRQRSAGQPNKSDSQDIGQIGPAGPLAEDRDKTASEFDGLELSITDEGSVGITESDELSKFATAGLANSLPVNEKALFFALVVMIFIASLALYLIYHRRKLSLPAEQ